MTDPRTLPALRMSLRNMLADVTYPTFFKSVPWVEARLAETTWTAAQWDSLVGLVLRWAQSKGPSVHVALRRALGEDVSEEEGTVLPGQARRDSTREAFRHASTTGETSMIAESLVEHEKNLMTPAFARELMIVAREMERPPYLLADENAPTRLSRAITCVQDGRVARQDDGSYLVRGSGKNAYTCTTECTCPQSQKGRSKWCYHLIAVELFKETCIRAGHKEPELFPASKTVEARLAEAPAVVPEETTPMAPPAPATMPEIPPLDPEQLQTLRKTIVMQLTSLGCTLSTKAQFEEAVLVNVGLVLAPENFGLITERLQELVEAHAKAPQPPRAAKEYMVNIKGKDFIKYEGLLAMAHEHGLRSIKVEFVTLTPTLASAIAVVTFADGRSFTEAADATPENVNKGVMLHFARCALTRAKARALRDALNIGEIALEESDV